MQFVKWQYMKIVLYGQCQNCNSVSFWTQNLCSLAPTCNKYKVTILGWFSLFVRISVSIREEKKERRCVGLPIPAAFSSPKGHHPTHNNNNIHLATVTYCYHSNSTRCKNRKNKDFLYMIASNSSL